MTDWTGFVDKTKQLKPRTLLRKALKHVQTFDYALDFGAGGLRDTRLLIQQPFKQVDILDNSPKTEQIAKTLPGSNHKTFTLQYTQFTYTPHRYNIINAQYALPFIKQESQKEVFKSLIESLTLGGIFTGNVFGEDDEWNDGQHNDTTFYTEEEIKQLLKDLDIIHFKERKYREKSELTEAMEDWHVYEFIAQRPDQG